jgi:hypothetical protein
VRPVGIVDRTRNWERTLGIMPQAGNAAHQPARMAMTLWMAPILHYCVATPTFPCVEYRDNPKVHIPHQKQGSQLQPNKGAHIQRLPPATTPRRISASTLSNDATNNALILIATYIHHTRLTASPHGRRPLPVPRIFQPDRPCLPRPALSSPGVCPTRPSSRAA